MKRITVILLLTFTACGPAVEVYQETFNGKNMIYNYEWFFDAHGSLQAKQRSIASHSALVAAAEGPEKTKLQMELTGMQNVCRTLASEYNANARKANRNIFKDDTPDSISMDICEGNQT